jgi:PAS domain S-box-containing protein
MAALIVFVSFNLATRYIVTQPGEFFPFVFIGISFLAWSVGVVAWRRHGMPGAASLAGLMLFVGWWAFMSGLELAADDLPTKILCSQMAYIGITGVPVWWFLFALSYSGLRQRLINRHWWRRTVALLWIIPVTTMISAAMYGWPIGLWSQITLRENGTAQYIHNGWFWIHAVYSYTLCIGGVVLIIRAALQLPRSRWPQIVLLVVASLFPLLMNFLFLSDLGPLPGLDLTVLGFAVAGLAMAWNILGFHLLDLGPIARSLLFDDIQDAVLVLDLEDRLMDINPAALRLLGLSQAPIGQLIFDVLADWQEQLAPYRSSPETEFELALQMPDQRLRYFEIRISPLHDQRRQLCGRIILARDMTEQHQAASRMRQLQRAVEHGPTSVVITDTQGQIEYVNPKFTRLTGYTLEEVQGKNPNILKTGHTSPDAYAQMWQAIAAGREWHGEFLNRKKNGETYWEEAHIGPVFAIDGRITHYVAVKEDITARKQVEDELNANRLRLRAIFDNMSAGITLLDRTGRYIQANQRWFQMIGYTPEELYMFTPADVTHPADRAAEEDLSWSLLSGQINSFSTEKRYVRKDGSIFWADLSVTSIRNSSGAVEASLGVIVDTTQRKAHEEALRQYAERLLLLMRISMDLNRSPDLERVLVLAADGLVRVLNLDQVGVALLDEVRQWLMIRTYRQELEEPILKTVKIPDIVAGSALQQLIETAAPVVIEEAAHDPLLESVQDTVRAEHIQSLLLLPLLVQGEFIGYISCDVTETTRIFTPEEIDLAHTVANLLAIRIEQTRLLEDERRLRQQTQDRAAELQGVISASRDGVCMMGMDRRVSVINQPALHLLALPGTPVDWRGRSVRGLLLALQRYAPSVAPVALAELRRMLRDGEDGAGEGEITNLGRTIHWFSLPVRVNDQLIGWLFLLRDRTEELALEQLREDMTRTMVHDLRNPLSSIQGAMDMLLDRASGDLEPVQQELASIAQRGTQRMLTLVNAILDVSQLESGRMPVNAVPLSLNDIAEDVLQAQTALVQRKALRIVNQMPPALPPVLADPQLLPRILQNLVGNAIKFTPPGGQVRLSAQIVTADSQPAALHVSVADTGPGIAPEVRDQLFQKFVTGRHAERGTGLGLAFCKLALEAHGQRIWVESQPGQGTTFTFSLALSAASSAA